MRKAFASSLLLAIIALVSIRSAHAGYMIIDPANNNFTSPSIPGGYEYGSVPSWTPVGGGAGVAANGSAFGVLASPSGQAAFLQGGDGTIGGVSISQTVSGFAGVPGLAEITFLAEDRLYVNGGVASQSMNVYLNGTLIDTVTPTSTTGFTSYTTPLVAVNAGTNTISFAGGGSGGDSTTFVTGVTIAATPEPASIVTLGLACVAGLFWLRRRRQG